MIINHNLAGANAIRQMNVNSATANKSMQKLSSGLRINSASDDAAGLAISEKMRGQIRGLDQASANSQDAISLIQTAEGALSETHSMLQRMRELSVQSASATYTDEDRTQINSEFQQLKSEIDDVSTQTKFNKQTLLDGTFGNSVDQNSTKSTALAVAGVTSITGNGAAAIYTIVDNGTDFKISDAAGNSVTLAGATMADGAQTLKIDKFDITIQTGSAFSAAELNGTKIEIGGNGQVDFQTGANSGEKMTLGINDMSSTGLGIKMDDLASSANATTAMTNLDTAIKSVSDERATLGAKQNRLEHRIANLGTSSENLSSAESRIRDVDMAKEMSTFSKNNILSQAAQAMLAQANQQPQQVLQLLR